MNTITYSITTRPNFVFSPNFVIEHETEYHDDMLVITATIYQNQSAQFEQSLNVDNKVITYEPLV